MTGTLEIMETRKQKLRRELHKAQYTNLYVNVSAGSLEEISVQIFGEFLKSIFMKIPWPPESHSYSIEQMTALMFSGDAFRVMCQ